MSEHKGVSATPTGLVGQSPEPASSLGHSATIPNALTAERVEAVLLDCLHREDESLDGGVEAQGIINRYSFHPNRLKSHAAEIGQMLSGLPDEFWSDRGGGWSFLNACMDRNGGQWTGFHRTQEWLFVLGIATGQAAWLLPREMWSALPGGLPYVSVTPAIAMETGTAETAGLGAQHDSAVAKPIAQGGAA